MPTGRSICVYGVTGSGKTTLAGELARDVFKQRGKQTLYRSADLGGHDSIDSGIDQGYILVDEIGPEDDPWLWIAKGCDRKNISEDVGMVVNDSGTTMGEFLLNYITHSPWKVGQQNTQKFTVTGPASKDAMTIGLNNEAHYGLVQSFMLDQIWKSMYITRQGPDVLWTFGEWRGEDARDVPVIGPKVVGKALTPAIPRWFKYTFRAVSVPQADLPDRHLLQLVPQPEMNGVAVAMANSRYPLNATTPLPAFIEPASLVKAMELIAQGQQEARENERIN